MEVVWILIAIAYLPLIIHGIKHLYEKRKKSRKV